MSKTVKMIKAPATYFLVDDKGEIRGSSNRYISTIDIARDIGLTITEEQGVEEWLKSICSSAVSQDSSQSGVSKKK